MAAPRKVVLTIANVVCLAVLIVAGLITLITGGVLANRSLVVGLGFAAVAAVVFLGLWKASRPWVGAGCVGMVVAPLIAQWVGAPVDPGSHLTTALGVGLLYAVWLVTWPHRIGAPTND